jgi:hypothetical protein
VRHTGLTIAAVTCASISLIALLLHAAGWLPLYFMVETLSAPSLVLLMVLGVVAYRIHEFVFLDRLMVGVWASLLATLAYDLSRLLLWKSGIYTFNPFYSHVIFGKLITGLSATTCTVIATGWAYHIWNGLGLGLMYTLLAGRAHWYYAVIWALFLEVAWLLALPSVVHFKLNSGFVGMSLIGHCAYGTTLGLLAQRYIGS